MSRNFLRALALGGIIGLGLGLYYGWVVSPPERVSSGPTALRQDYKDDYVLMIAEAYSVDDDLAQAKSRLAALGLKDPGPPVAALAERLINAGQDNADIRRLAALAAALGHTTPAIAPYLP
ncbi:MAG: hypothetical protein HY260_00745 [Chloroflexi bacterium]|nr:hypothetical protein [Chloroflexota bacterium]